MEGNGVAFERLHWLVRKGYKPALGAEGAGESIALRHLAKAPDLVLHADGSIEGLGGRVPHYKRKIDPPSIPAEREADQVEFLKFLDTVPRATLIDRTRRLRTRYIYLPIAVAGTWAASIGLTALFTGGI